MEKDLVAREQALVERNRLSEARMATIAEKEEAADKGEEIRKEVERGLRRDIQDQQREVREARGLNDKWEALKRELEESKAELIEMRDGREVERQQHERDMARCKLQMKRQDLRMDEQDEVNRRLNAKMEYRAAE